MALLQRVIKKSIAHGVGVALFLLAISYSSSVLAERPQLQILSAIASADNTSITITGRFFVASNDSAATVTFDDTSLAIGSISETEIQAVLPAQLNDGSFLLTVSRGNGALQNDQLLVTIQQEPRVFASAWTYDQRGNRRLIAQVEDTNGDGIVSVGDTVRTSEYPLSQNGAIYESFTTTTHDVTFVENATNTQVYVSGGPSNSMLFGWTYIKDSEDIDVVSNQYLEAWRPDGPYTRISNYAHGPKPDLWEQYPCGTIYTCYIMDWDADIQTQIGSPSGPLTELLYDYDSSNASLYEVLDLIRVIIDVSPP